MKLFLTLGLRDSAAILRKILYGIGVLATRLLREWKINHRHGKVYKRMTREK